MKNLFYTLLTLLLVSAPALAKVETANVSIIDEYVAPQITMLGAMVDRNNGEIYYVSAVISVLAPKDLDKGCFYKIHYYRDPNRADRTIVLIPPMEKLNCGEAQLVPRQREILEPARHAETDEELTEVERSSCSTFPQVTPLAAAAPGLQYDVDQRRECIIRPDLCHTNTKVTINYKYTQVRVVDYYNSAGKIALTKTFKDVEWLKNYELEGSVGAWNYTMTGYTPMDAAAKVQLSKLYGIANEKVVLDIQRNIFRGEEVCPGSFYK